MPENILPMGDVTSKMVIEVTDNWYAVFTKAGRLLMVGTYLPAEADGVVFMKITPEQAREMLAKLEQRTHETGPVTTIVMEG